MNYFLTRGIIEITKTTEKHFQFNNLFVFCCNAEKEKKKRRKLRNFSQNLTTFTIDQACERVYSNQSCLSFKRI